MTPSDTIPPANIHLRCRRGSEADTETGPGHVSGAGTGPAKGAGARRAQGGRQMPLFAELRSPWAETESGYNRTARLQGRCITMLDDKLEQYIEDRVIYVVRYHLLRNPKPEAADKTAENST